MRIATLGDDEIAYQIVGHGQPWVLTPGGRFSKDHGGIREMAEALAGRGRMVLIYDRLNCGASSIRFTGPTESTMHADSLAELLRVLDFGPTVLIGGSAGARVSLLTAARHPEVVAGAGIWWVTGGVFVNTSLAMRYYAASLGMVWNGSMDDVAGLADWAEVVERNPSNAARFRALDRVQFRETMARWMQAFLGCGDPLVQGLSDDEAVAISRPVLVVRGAVSDMYHPRGVSDRLAAHLPTATLVEPPWADHEYLERQASADAGGSVLEGWPALVPQLVEWADRTV